MKHLIGVDLKTATIYNDTRIARSEAVAILYKQVSNTFDTTSYNKYERIYKERNKGAICSPAAIHIFCGRLFYRSGCIYIV